MPCTIIGEHSLGADTSGTGYNLGRFVTLSSLLSIPAAQMFLICCLAYCEQLLFTELPLKDEIYEQGLTGQKITLYESTYLPSAAKNLVSLAPGICLQLLA